jgi:hypothetical protein
MVDVILFGAFPRPLCVLWACGLVPAVCAVSARLLLPRAKIGGSPGSSTRSGFRAPEHRFLSLVMQWTRFLILCCWLIVCLEPFLEHHSDVSLFFRPLGRAFRNQPTTEHACRHFFLGLQLYQLLCVFCRDIGTLSSLERGLIISCVCFAARFSVHVSCHLIPLERYTDRRRRSYCSNSSPML